MLRQLAVALLVSRIHPYLCVYDTVVCQRKSSYTTLSSIVPFCPAYFFEMHIADRKNSARLLNYFLFFESGTPSS
jgi:hypothetical protein